MRIRAAAAAAVFSTAALGVFTAVALAGPSAAAAERFTYSGVVTRVVDGDTVDVRLVSGRRERVRLIGIDAAERGSCYAGNATRRAEGLALDRRVTLRGDATQDARDRYGRLLAYVDVGGRADLGAALIRGGFGSVYVYDRPFARLAAYRAAQANARAAGAGRWKACAAAAPVAQAAPPVGGGCHPSYTNCLPVVDDLDCADVRRLGKAPVRVLGSDPYRLDGDGDGFGCE